MKIIIIGGFLGSGKTSIILQMARYLVGEEQCQGTDVVILENEIGEVSIDDKILKSKGYQVENMFSGCVVVPFRRTGRKYYEYPESVSTEVADSGSYRSCLSKKIKESIESVVDAKCKICCIADAKRWKRLKGPMSNFIYDQMDEADIILINKVDLVSDTEKEQIGEEIKAINAEAVVQYVSASKGISENVWETIFYERKENLI